MAIINALGPYSYIDFTSVTTSGGKVTALVDQVPAGTGIRAITASHTFAQADSAKQVVTPAADAKFGGALSGLFNATENYVSNSTVAAWKCAHDGTGWTCYTGAWSSNVGAIAYINGTRSSGVGMLSGHLANAAGIWYVNNGTTFILADSIGSYTVNVASICRVSYSETESPKCVHKVGAADAFSPVPGGAPSASDPGSPMVFGGRQAGTSMWAGGLGFQLVFNRVVTAAEDTVIRAALARLFPGVT